MTEASGAEVDFVVRGRHEGAAGLGVGDEAKHEIGEQTLRVRCREEGAVGVETGLLEEGGLAAEGESVDGDLGVGRREDSVHGGNVLYGLRVGDGYDEDAALEGGRGRGILSRNFLGAAG